MFALLSAALFGAGMPLAKLLLGGTDAWLLAGLLYVGAAIGLSVILLARRPLKIAVTDQPLRRQDLPWLAGAVLAGGVTGPALLMLGLAHTPASSASLLLNLEVLATMAIAWAVFGEVIGRRLLLGAAAILAGAALVSWMGSVGTLGWGAAAIAGACLAWGIDNNLTRRLSHADALQITLIKGVVAGPVNLGLALGHGAALPSLGVTLAAGIIGVFCYGVSLSLFVMGLRHMGAARTGAYFATAPFVGAAIAVPMFAEPVTPRLLAAAVLMGGGVALLLADHQGDTDVRRS